tara:strand:- start:161 stop:655 length:495 start_codon:yes stop_codon:yes gene_type:complete
MQTKACSKCGEIKDVSLFHKDKRGMSGVRGNCKDCFSSAQKVRNATPEGKAYVKTNNAKRYEGNPMWNKHRRANSSAIRLGLPGRITEQQVTDLFAEHGYCCYYCNLQSTDPSIITLDHYYPMATGGKNTIQNCVPACAKCNESKKDRDPEEFIKNKAKKDLTT